jgi:hypothetical protein
METDADLKEWQSFDFKYYQKPQVMTELSAFQVVGGKMEVRTR